MTIATKSWFVVVAVVCVVGIATLHVPRSNSAVPQREIGTRTLFLGSKSKDGAKSIRKNEITELGGGGDGIVGMVGGRLPLHVQTQQAAHVDRQRLEANLRACMTRQLNATAWQALPQPPQAHRKARSFVLPLLAAQFAELEKKMVRSHARMRDAINKAIPTALQKAVVGVQGAACTTKEFRKVLFKKDGSTDGGGGHSGGGACNRTRLVIFGGSMTWGRDAVFPAFRPMCPGCSDPRIGVNIDGDVHPDAHEDGGAHVAGLEIFTNKPHCCK